MADNYLEKRHEAYRVQSVLGGVRKSAVSVARLALKAKTAAFDASYMVRPDQLNRIVEALGVVDSTFIRCCIVPSSVSAAVGSEFENVDVRCGAFILLGLSGDVDNERMISLGCCLQMMQLQAAEIGLCVAYTLSFDVSRVTDALSLSFRPFALLAVGRAAK